MVPDKDIPRIDYIDFLCLDAVLPRRKAHQHHLWTSHITTQPLYFILFVPHSIFMTDYTLLADELQRPEFLHITLSWFHTCTAPFIQPSYHRKHKPCCLENCRLACSCQTCIRNGNTRS